MNQHTSFGSFKQHKNIILLFIIAITFLYVYFAYVDIYFTETSW